MDELLIIFGIIVAGHFAIEKYFNPKIEIVKIEVLAAMKDFENYKNLHPLPEDESARLEQQASMIAELERELEDIKHREALLLFKLNVGQGGASTQPRRRQAPVIDILPPEPRQAAGGAIGELYDD